MPLRRRQVLVGLLLALLPALVASTARPAAELPLKRVSIGNLSQDSGLPAFTSGVYALSVNGYNCTWNVNVSGSVITGTMICPPATRADGLSGTVVQGTSVTVTRDCSEAFAGCSQAYVATTFEGGMFKGTMTGSGGGGSFTLTPMTPPADTPPAEDCSQSRAFPPPGVAKLATPDPDCSRPKVRAFPYPGVVKLETRKKEPETRITLRFSVKDDSGHAKARVTLFEGGQYIRNLGYNGKATGRKLPWTVPLAAKLKGPLFFCVWAKDAAGNKSAGAPRSSCGWISLLVPIERVSNGCGGEGWDSVVAIENYFGNTTTYYGADGTPYEVSFVAACNLHDAGYGGQTVEDTLNGGALIDFSTWTRKDIDEKFRADMWKLCDKKIPESEPRARSTCYGNLRYNTVRTVGSLFFDADPISAGTQDTGPRNND